MRYKPALAIPGSLQLEWSRCLDGHFKKEHHQKIDDVMARICRSENVSIVELKAGSRRKEVSGVRARIAIGLVKRHGVALAEVARRVGYPPRKLKIQIGNREKKSELD